MTSRHSAVADLVAHLEAAGSTTSARHRLAAWTQRDPALAAWCSPAELAAAVRLMPPTAQDPILTRLLTAAGGEDLAAVTATAVLARALGALVSGWARTGLPPSEVEAMEAELVAGAWEAAARLGRRAAAGGEVSDRVGLRIVDAARDQVRCARRRERRRVTHQTALPQDAPVTAGGLGPSGAEAAAAEIVDGVRGGRLPIGPARALYLTRVAGWPTDVVASWLGTSPGAVRVIRGRAARALLAA